MVDFAEGKEHELNTSANSQRDAVWCIMALCHDLGYSLAKLENLNKMVKSVVDFFDIRDIKHIGYSIDVENQFLVSQFLELMAMDVRIVPSENYDDKKVGLEERALIKCFRDDQTYWSLCRALEGKQHGILSSYLIYKILDIFADTSVLGPGESWGLEDADAVGNMIRGDILFAIAQHEFEFAHLNQFNSLADILFVADELEEFSRYGRQLVSRRYRDTVATPEIQFLPNKPKRGDDIEVEITYHVAEHRSLGSFFQYKAERLCKIYSLEQERYVESQKLCTIKSIKMTAEKDGQEVYFYLHKDINETAGYLPATAINGERHGRGKHKLFCIDDVICFKDSKGNAIPLEKWFEGVQHSWWKKEQEREVS